jgi:rubrerythrin
MEVQPQTIKILTSLAHLDIDASQAYQQALDNIASIVICNTLTNCLRDHEHHYKDICRMIDSLGSIPPEYGIDFKGYIIQGCLTLISFMNTQSLLKAIRKNEILNIKYYEKALGENVTPEARRFIEKGLADERRHLSYINEVLKLDIL